MSYMLGFQVSQLGCIRGQTSLYNDIYFHLSPGDLLLVEGPNGSGKTTLLRQCASLSFPDTGSIRWQGKEISDDSLYYRKDVHYVGHGHGIKLALTVGENAALMCELSGCFLATELQKSIDAVLQLLDLYQHKHDFVFALSAGQKRRLSLARLWLIKKPLWILDEPLTSLDEASRELFLGYLKHHLSEQGVCILSSHQPVSLAWPKVHTLKLS